MTATTILDDDHYARTAASRHQLLAELAAAEHALARAADTLGQLRGRQLYDAELVDGRDGRDIGTFLDDGLRYVRAAYAVVHVIIGKET